jgi:hypothetical protein
MKVMSYFETLSALVGKTLAVKVSAGNRTATKSLKLCKVKVRSILFIEVDKTNRVNTFRKFPFKSIADVTESVDGITTVEFLPGVLPEKWESHWDAIGTYSHSVGNSLFNPSNHMKPSRLPYVAKPAGWKPGINSAAGFPMV